MVIKNLKMGIALPTNKPHSFDWNCYLLDLGKGLSRFLVDSLKNVAFYTLNYYNQQWPIQDYQSDDETCTITTFKNFKEGVVNFSCFLFALFNIFCFSIFFKIKYQGAPKRLWRLHWHSGTTSCGILTCRT